jgi:hypothetical protein
MSKLVIKIVDSGTIYHDPTKGDHQSLTGHMWWELYSDDGEIIGSYGFAPAPGHEGKPFAPGFRYENDNIAYEL